jgi:aspartyl-tRNA(Asn)/glutamyl-tRNA(Gln) amidotransferase subunit A
VLPSCVYQASDYLHATREHRRIVAEMRPLYERYDVMLTAGAGPAPRLDAHRIANFFQTPQAFTPANLTGGPALALPAGFSGGLPLGMQILGRPFDEATVLRAGHAYQQATDWHLRHPQLTAGATQPQVSPRYHDPQATDLDATARGFVLDSARRAGLKLDDRLTAILLETAPFALDVADRLRKPRRRSEAPALVFRVAGH